MLVREKKSLPPRKAPQGQPTRKEAAQSYSFPAPIRGWVLSESLSMPQPGAARVLDNWICGLTTIKPRKGYTRHGTTTDECTALLTYKSGSEKFFACTGTDIYDMTAPADPDVAPTADVTGLTGGNFFGQMFSTTAGDYLYAVNGDDDAQLYDGTTWTAINGVSTPAITGVTTANLSFVWSHGNRLWFVEDGSKSAWYLPVDSIGGAATEFPLDGVFKKGGTLYFGASWSLDAGDGLDDKCVFVSTEGEIAVYSGVPGSSFALEGLYESARPLGRQTMKAGGDLLILTEVGLVPLSEALRRDAGALSLGAVSRPIEPYWRSQAAALATEWNIQKWTEENLLVVSQPNDSTALVANLQTGAWSRFTNMDTRCIGVFGGAAFFGSTDGSVYRMETGGQDYDMPYTVVYIGQFERLGAPGVRVSVKQMRATFRASAEINPQVSALVDYDETPSPAPNAATSSATDGWDVSTWDVSLWDAGGGTGFSPDNSRWVTINRSGYAIAPEVQMTFGGTSGPDADLIDIHATFTDGNLVS